MKHTLCVSNQPRGSLSLWQQQGGEDKASLAC